MSSHWSREHGRDVGYLAFGERFRVTEVSMYHSGERVRGLVEKWDGCMGFISMYSTTSMQQFVVSMEGEPPWSRVRDLFPPLIRALQQPRLPCGCAPAPMAFESLSEGSSRSS